MNEPTAIIAGSLLFAASAGGWIQSCLRGQKLKKLEECQNDLKNSLALQEHDSRELESLTERHCQLDVAHHELLAQHTVTLTALQDLQKKCDRIAAERNAAVDLDIPTLLAQQSALEQSCKHHMATIVELRTANQDLLARATDAEIKASAALKSEQVVLAKLAKLNKQHVALKNRYAAPGPAKKKEK